MKKLLLFLLVFIFFASCSHRRTAADTIELGKSTVQYNSVNEYLEAKPGDIDTTFWIKFMFFNNPYNLDTNNIISIYVNYELVYRGAFNTYLDLCGNPEKIFGERNHMLFRLEILTDKRKKVIWEHCFMTKAVFSWNENYKMVYCGFFPTNEDVEKVCFFPQSEVVW